MVLPVHPVAQPALGEVAAEVELGAGLHRLRAAGKLEHAEEALAGGQEVPAAAARRHKRERVDTVRVHAR